MIELLSMFYIYETYFVHNDFHDVIYYFSYINNNKS